MYILYNVQEKIVFFSILKSFHKFVCKNLKSALENVEIHLTIIHILNSILVLLI